MGKFTPALTPARYSIRAVGIDHQMQLAQRPARAGIEGTLFQAVRLSGLRRTHYRGLVKTHLQHVATAAAVNIDRIAAWLIGRPHAATRTSSFAALANCLPAIRQQYASV